MINGQFHQPPFCVSFQTDVISTELAFLYVRTPSLFNLKFILLFYELVQFKLLSPAVSLQLYVQHLLFIIRANFVFLRLVDPFLIFAIPPKVITQLKSQRSTLYTIYELIHALLLLVLFLASLTSQLLKLSQQLAVLLIPLHI